MNFYAITFINLHNYELTANKRAKTHSYPYIFMHVLCILQSNILITRCVFRSSFVGPYFVYAVLHHCVNCPVYSYQNTSNTNAAISNGGDADGDDRLTSQAN